MKIRDIMTSAVITIGEEAPLVEAARVMKENDIGALPVLNEGVCTGIITDRDIVVRAIAEGQDPYTATIRDAMTTDCVFCFEDQDLEEGVQMMEDHHIRRLLVTDRNERLVGILTLQNIADADDETLSSEALEAVTEPETAGAA